MAWPQARTPCRSRQGTRRGPAERSRSQRRRGAWRRSSRRRPPADPPQEFSQSPAPEVAGAPEPRAAPRGRCSSSPTSWPWRVAPCSGARQARRTPGPHSSPRGPWPRQTPPGRSAPRRRREPPRPPCPPAPLRHPGRCRPRPARAANMHSGRPPSVGLGPPALRWRSWHRRSLRAGTLHALAPGNPADPPAGWPRATPRCRGRSWASGRRSRGSRGRCRPPAAPARAPGRPRARRAAPQASAASPGSPRSARPWRPGATA
mmetsp:Transcript_108646/g.324920  ORF Transcript_108646/g.324920 Transcript_108646/m.324920 type:complete len:261 (+) Transcript_108646:684-1466(+)